MPETALPPAWALIPPAVDRSAGQEAIDLLRRLDFPADDWQEEILLAGMGRDRAGRWAADEVCEVIPRQNGKTLPLFGRALWGVVHGGERLLRWSSHEFKTSGESYYDLRALCEHEAFPLGARFYVSNGKEAIHFSNGARLTFIARSRSSGRGMGADLLVLDEALMIRNQHMAALKATQAARKRPQIWLASSAPLEDSEVLRRYGLAVRRGEAKRLCYLEWCASPDDDPTDPATWRKANPALGSRLSDEFTESELLALSPEDFARERLGIWHEDETPSVFGAGVWESCRDVHARPGAGARFAVAADVAPDRSRASIAAAGLLEDGRVVVEVVEARENAAWVPAHLRELVAARRPSAVAVDGSGQGAAVLAELDRMNVKAERVNAEGMVAACAGMFDRVIGHRLAHLGQRDLDDAVAGARQRELGDSGWAWSRRRSSSDITPLVAATLAVEALAGNGPGREVFIV